MTSPECLEAGGDLAETPLYTPGTEDYYRRMSSEFDPSEFVDDEFQAARQSQSKPSTGRGAPAGVRAPSREEIESQALEKQQRIAELKREQQDLERARAALEELRRRQNEFQTGRAEMVQNLTRGVALLEEAEFSLRRDAEQTAKALTGLREGLDKIQSIHEDTWTADSLETELTRALTAVENARMEWNSARLKFSILSGEAGAAATSAGGPPPAAEWLQQKSYAEWCKLGLALTWPVLLAGSAIFIALILR